MLEFEKKDTYQASEVKRMKALYEGGGLTRRQFVQGMMAVGVTATTATAILTGSLMSRPPHQKRAVRSKLVGPHMAPLTRLTPRYSQKAFPIAAGAPTITVWSSSTMI